MPWLAVVRDPVEPEPIELRVLDWAQAKTAGESQAVIERLLATAIAEQKSLRKAIDALSVDANLHEFVSRERLAELKQLLSLPAAQLEQRIGEHQEVAD